MLLPMPLPASARRFQREHPTAWAWQTAIVGAIVLGIVAAVVAVIVGLKSFTVYSAWLMPAFCGAAFVILALIRNFLPRKGDWVSIFAITGAFTIFFFLVHDYLTRTSGSSLAGFDNYFD